MKKWICLLLLAAPATDISSFRWLAGTWRNVKTGELEEWKKVGNEWKGRSYKVAGKDTTVSEMLTIRCKSGDCTFTAEVGENAAPVTFKVVKATHTGFRVENPEHDFPKYVAYSLESPKNLYAEIGDGSKKIPYRFEKVR